ncbi:hypothetical protein [Paraburkholderia hospita]|uniref:hypothetical protein n=1 Tax=Paraburkholderia hospita TaxID=169430 RepID=UPI000271BFE7|nr:hypothetical protein [Paraburkholderia hospita]EUC21462.1 hypothetical protein PMI06_009178 [Burkholderia sp. BT03]SKC95339.1 hypothetical protein SAMN06266956_6907 [Paraburkholderia hospita]
MSTQRMDAAERYARVVADLAHAHVPFVVREGTSGKFVSIVTKSGTHVFTIGREHAVRAGLLPPKSSRHP